MNKVFPFQAYIFLKNQVLHLTGTFLIELPPYLFLQYPIVEVVGTICGSL
jgi:hypothetical protein